MKSDNFKVNPSRELRDGSEQATEGSCKNWGGPGVGGMSFEK